MIDTATGRAISSPNSKESVSLGLATEVEGSEVEAAAGFEMTVSRGIEVSAGWVVIGYKYVVNGASMLLLVVTIVVFCAMS